MACAAHMDPSRIAALGLLSSDGPYASMPQSVFSQMFSLTEEEQHELSLQERKGKGRQLTPHMSLLRAQQNYSDMHTAFSTLSKPERKELALADLEHAARQGLDKVSMHVYFTVFSACLCIVFITKFRSSLPQLHYIGYNLKVTVLCCVLLTTLLHAHQLAD